MRPLEFRVFSGPANVTWFGAKGNGRTDDSRAIQDAIDYFGTTGGTVTVPRGIYSLESTLTIGSATSAVQGVVLQSESKSKAFTGGTLFRWQGAVDTGPMMRIRNAATGAIENIGFDGNNRASYGLQMQHVQDVDVDALRTWDIRGCHFSGARTYNVLIGDLADLLFGDACCLSFYSCNFGHSFAGAPTVAHARLHAGETFSTAFYNCQFSGDPVTGGYPSYGISIQAGTADVHSALFETLGIADIYMDARAGKPLPAVNVFGAHSQSAQFLKTNTGGASTVANATLASTNLIGVYHADIIAPTSVNSVYWDMRSHGALTLTGCRFQGNVEIDYAAAAVFSNGVYFDNVSGNFTGVGAGRVCGTWQKNSIYNFRHPDMGNHANNAAAIAAGLSVGDLYRTAGAVMVVV